MGPRPGPWHQILDIKKLAAGAGHFLGAEPKEDVSENQLTLPPQCYHIDFDEELKMNMNEVMKIEGGWHPFPT